MCGTVSSVNSLCTLVSGIDCVAGEPAKCMIVYKWESSRPEGSGVCVCVCVCDEVKESFSDTAASTVSRNGNHLVTELWPS